MTRPRRERAFAFTLVLLTLVAGLGGWSLWRDRDLAIDAAYGRLEDRARIADGWVSGRLRAIDLLLADVVRMIPANGAPPMADLFARVPGHAYPEIGHLFAADADGVIFMSTLPDIIGFDVGHRADFQKVARAPDRKTLHLSGPIPGAMGTIAFFAGRPLGDPGEGMVGAALSPEFFIAALEPLRPPGGHLMLVNSDGAVVVATDPAVDRPPEAVAVGLDGRFRFADQGVTRLGVARPTDFPGLTLVATRPLAAALAPWRREAVLRGGVFAVLALVILALARRFRRYEGRLLAAKTFTDNLIDTAPVAIVGLDDAGCLRICNSRMARLAGWDPGEVRDESWVGLGGPPALVPGGDEVPGQLEAPLTTRDGVIRQIAWRTARVGDGPVRVLAFGEDVTERRETEAETRALKERLQLATAAGGIGVWEWAPRTDMLVCDTLTRQLFGLDPHGLSAASALREAIHPDDRAGHEAAVRAALAGHGAFAHEFRVVRPDGTAVLRSAGAVARDQAGRAERLIGVTWDISAQKTAETALDQARRRAESANRAKSDFLANMSQDIRPPMNTVLGLAGMLQDSGLDDRQQDYVEKLEASARALLALLDDILDYARVEAGLLEPEVAPFHLAGLMDGLARHLSVHGRDLEVAIAIDPDVPSVLVGDARRLHQILVNLAGNALKFTERGEVVVRVAPVARAGDRVRLRFAVTDTGIGLSPEQQAGLFQPLGETEVAGHLAGSGLGLAICHRLVTLMGGRIGVESRPGGGSTFWFAVPLGVGAEGAPAPAPALSVLVADDNPTARDVIAAMASGLGWTVTVVADGAAALEEVRGRGEPPFDMVLLDWRMPGLDGLAVADAIRREAGDGAPLLVLTTAHGRDRVLAAPRAGAVDAVLVKPLTPTTLRQVVSDHLAARKPIRQPLAGLELLLVEDDPISRDVGAELLDRIGARVVTAADGAEAVAQVLAHPGLDLVLMDVQMPEVDGIEATRRIRDLGRRMPILALSATVHPEERERCLAAGMAAFLAKPLDMVEVQKTVCGLTGRPVAAAQAAPAPAPATGDPLLAVLTTGDTIDVAGALARAMGNEGLLADLIRRFTAAAPEALARVRTARTAGDDAEAARALHALRGTAANAGAEAVVAAARAAEQALAAGADPGTHLASLTAAVDAVCAAVAAASGPAAGGEPPAGDAVLTGAALADFRDLLKGQNIRALDLYADLAPALAGRLTPAAAASLARAMEGLDFHAACALIDPLIDETRSAGENEES